MTLPIQISRSVANWLIAYGRTLVSDGIGNDWDPCAIEPPVMDGLQDALLDHTDVHTDPRLHYWVVAMFGYIRTIAGILAQKMRECEAAEALQILDDGFDSDI